MRSDPVLATVPFLLLSAARPRALEEANAFLPKPVDLRSFETAVQEMLGPPQERTPQQERRR